MRKHSLASKTAAWIEAHYTIPQGQLTGNPFRLLPWERRYLVGTFDGEAEQSSLSVARGNGKTAFLSAILASSVDVGGPLVEANAEAVLVAGSFEQARIAYSYVLRFLAKSIEKHGTGPRGRFRIEDSTSRCRILDKETGASVRVLGSDPRRAHGLAPRIVLWDEMAQFPPGRLYEMMAALSTSMGKIKGAKFCAIGTRPSNPNHPFSLMLTGADGYAQVHAAAAEDPPFQRRTWVKANPSLSSMPVLEATIRREADMAKRDPDRLASFSALRLNQGTSDVRESFLLSPQIWEGMEREHISREGQYILGVDLGQNQAQSAVAAYWPESGALVGYAIYPEYPSLEERGRKDSVGLLYVNCARRGELGQAGPLVSDVGSLLREAISRWGRPSLIVADHWRRAQLCEELAKAGVPFTSLETRRMGPQDGSEDVRDFRSACMSDAVHPERSLLLRSALAEARTLTDSAGNEKLSKGMQGGRRMHGRDDSIAAALLAVAAGWRRKRRGPRPEQLTHRVVR